jgi:hypothetical protein
VRPKLSHPSIAPRWLMLCDCRCRSSFHSARAFRRTPRPPLHVSASISILISNPDPPKTLALVPANHHSTTPRGRCGRASLRRWPAASSAPPRRPASSSTAPPPPASSRRHSPFSGR